MKPVILQRQLHRWLNQKTTFPLGKMYVNNNECTKEHDIIIGLFNMDPAKK